MIRRVAILVGLPLLVAAVIAVPLGLWRGEYQWLCAGVAIAILVPPGVATLIVAERMSRSLFGPLLALAIGTMVRLFVGFGGAAMVFLLSKPTFHADPLSYWGWVLGLYLLTLITETALLSRMRPNAMNAVAVKATAETTGSAVPPKA